ncbi:hypothetical protein O3M35_010798 [Rhynocoris fuscipes]|uniref:Phosphatidic acid phosphatase type 2/haloperoxidase domain-containing protein n=1 Tax=Rhynocoris fuscipes TaxID=488301 RepID=A0AAW1D7F0_9HEMI
MGLINRIDLIIYALVTTPVIGVILLAECGVVPVLSPIGFRCRDPKLSYKYNGDTISARLLLLITFVSPFLVVVGAECWCNRYKSGVCRDCSWWKAAVIWYRDFLLGFLVVIAVTVVIKGIVGEPRPHFLDTCQPKEAKNCTNQFISKFECGNKNVSSYYIQDASKSFPSGHAAFSFYLFVFLAWFLQRRLEDVKPIVIITLQTIVLTWAIGCSLSRLTDHRHHWWDVLAGSFIGSFIAICSIKSLSIGLKSNEMDSASDNTTASLERKSTDSFEISSQELCSNTSIKWLIPNTNN